MHLILSNPYHLALLLLIIILLLFIVQPLQKKLKIQRWKKSLHLQHHEKVFQELYQKVDGFRLSRKARQDHNALDYTYGEIDFMSFVALLSLTKPNKDTVFYDLGSGTGKAVIACSMVFPVLKATGIELLKILHDSANQRVKLLSQHTSYAKSAHRIHFIHANFLEADLENATLIFINSTTIFNPTWENLCARLDDIPHLHTVITTSKPLINTRFSLAKTTKVQMSWGVVEAYIHTRKTNLN